MSRARIGPRHVRWDRLELAERRPTISSSRWGVGRFAALSHSTKGNGMSGGQIDTVMLENRRFPPSSEFAAKAKIGSMQAYEELYQRSIRDPEKFWGDLAREELHWFKPFGNVLEWDAPFARWFVGGQTNVSYNCLDAHLKTSRKNKTAIIWEGEPGEQRKLTYEELHREVCKFANALKALGLKCGDVATIYMPMTPELAIAMLACA